MTSYKLFLDTSTLLIMLGCPGRIVLPEEAKPVIHTVHLREAINRLASATHELYNTGRVDDKCLEKLADMVLREISPSRKRRQLQKLLVRRKATKIINKLLKRNEIAVYDEDSPGYQTCTPRRGEPLSRQDQVLLALAVKCYRIATCENGIIDCCHQLGIPDKCIKT